MESYNTRVNSALSIIQTKPKKRKTELNVISISKAPEINIIHNRPKLIDEEIQHENDTNYVDNKKLEIEIISNKQKPEYKDSVTKYEEQNKETIEE